MSRSEVQARHRTSRLSRPLLLALLCCIVVAYVVSFVAPVKASVWEVVYERTDFADEFALDRLYEVRECAGRFWFRRFLEDSQELKQKYNAGKVLSDLPDPIFRQMCVEAFEEIDANQFILKYLPSGLHHKESQEIIVRIDKVLNIDARLAAMRAKFADTPDMSDQDYWRLRQYSILSGLKKLQFSSDYDSHSLTPFKASELRPRLRLDEIRPGRAGFHYLEVDYGLFGRARAYASSTDFGRDLLIELFESEVNCDADSQRQFKSTRILRFTRGQYLNWNVCGVGMRGDANNAKRMAGLRQWQSKREFLNFIGKVEGAWNLNFEAISYVCRKLGVSYTELLSALESDNSRWCAKMSLEQDILLRSRFLDAQVPEKLSLHRHFGFDPLQHVMLTLDLGLFDKVTSEPQLSNFLFTARQMNPDDSSQIIDVFSSKLDWREQVQLNCTKQCIACLDRASKVFFKDRNWSFYHNQANLLSGGLVFPRVEYPTNWSKNSCAYVEEPSNNEPPGWGHAATLLKFQTVPSSLPFNYSSIFVDNVSSSDIGRVLSVLLPTERDRILDWLFLHSSVEGRNSYLRPHLSKARQDRLAVVNQRQIKLVELAVGSSLSGPFVKLDRQHKIEYLQYRCQTQQDYKFTSDQVDFILRERFFIKDAIKPYAIINGTSSFMALHRDLMARVITLYSNEVEHELLRLLSSVETKPAVNGLLLVLVELSKRLKGRPWFELTELFTVASRKAPETRCAIALFGLTPEEAELLYQSATLAMGPSESPFFNNPLLEDMIHGMATGDWRRCLAQIIDNEEACALVIWSIEFAGIKEILKRTATDQVLMQFYQLVMKYEISLQGHIPIKGLILERPLLRTSQEFLCVEEKIRKMYRGESDEGLATVFALVLSENVDLKMVRAHCKSDAHILKFCRLCHKLGPIALSEKEFLLKQLNHKRDRVVIAATLALSRVDWPANFMLERLTEIINDKSRSGYVRGAAICAMRRFEGNPKVGERLRELMNSKSLEPLLRDTAKRSLPVWEYHQEPVPTLLDWPADH